VLIEIEFCLHFRTGCETDKCDKIKFRNGVDTNTNTERREQKRRVCMTSIPYFDQKRWERQFFVHLRSNSHFLTCLSFYSTAQPKKTDLEYWKFLRWFKVRVTFLLWWIKKYFYVEFEKLKQTRQLQLLLVQKCYCRLQWFTVVKQNNSRFFKLPSSF
jgi:hypothetical protein